MDVSKNPALKQMLMPITQKLSCEVYIGVFIHFGLKNTIFS